MNSNNKIQVLKSMLKSERLGLNTWAWEMRNQHVWELIALNALARSKQQAGQMGRSSYKQEG